MISLAKLIDIRELEAALDRLKVTEDAVRVFREQQPVQQGERAVMVHQPDIYEGWRHYREVLVVGCTGTVESLDWNRWAHRWQAMFCPDVQWEVHEHHGMTRTLARHHHGPASGRGHKVFSLPVVWLRKTTDADAPLTRPADSEEWAYYPKQGLA
jgi:hypothetical protein